jgi:hypothetical protein
MNDEKERRKRRKRSDMTVEQAHKSVIDFSKTIKRMGESSHCGMFPDEKTDAIGNLADNKTPCSYFARVISELQRIF